MHRSWFSNAPISRKLTLLVQSSVAVALALSCAAFVLGHLYFVRVAMVQQLGALCDVLGANTSAALVFDDGDAATQLLGSLDRQPSVDSACVYDAAGATFATYAAPGVKPYFPPAPAQRGHVFTGHGFLEVFETIEADGERVGAILLRGNLSSAYHQVAVYLCVASLVMAVAFSSAYALARWMQRLISGPILALAQTAERISVDQDFSVRVTKQGDDELGVLYDQFNRMLEQVQTSERRLQEAQAHLELRVEERTRQLSEANAGLSKEVAERRRAERELERAHRDLIDAARHAGMAEIASGVLHNVGNVLNSVNVSATTITDRLRSSKRQQLDRVVDLLAEHRDDLGDFLTQDEKGRRVPEFLTKLAEAMRAEEDALAAEATLLASNIDHIKAIISTQQSYAGTSGVVEPVELGDLLEDALKLNSASFARHRVRVTRELATLPMVLLDKQRLLQIVINLIKNAKEALEGQTELERVLTLRTRVEGDRLLVQVADTGVGIAPESLARIFAHGYTTKSRGHGFGLHSCANAAAEMDGSLSVASPGAMRGATFTLNLPYKPAGPHAPAPATPCRTHAS